MLCQRMRQRAVVHMGVCDQHMGDGFAFQRCFQGLEMIILQRTRIDHGHFALADNVNAGAGVGECAGIVRHHTADHGGDLIHLAVFELNLFDEGYAHGFRLIRLGPSGLGGLSTLNAAAARSEPLAESAGHAPGGFQLVAKLQRHWRAHVCLVCIHDVNAPICPVA